MNQLEIDYLEQQGKSEAEIAKEIGLSRMGLYNLRKRKSWPKKRGRSDKGRPRKSPEEKREAFNRYQREYYHAHKPGYKNVRIGNTVISEHRYVMQEFLGRELRSREVVHHINGDIMDNRLENLKLFKSQSEHMRFHFMEKINGYSETNRENN